MRNHRIGDAGEDAHHRKAHRESDACREGRAHRPGGDGTVGDFFDLFVEDIDRRLGPDDKVADEHPDGG